MKSEMGKLVFESRYEVGEVIKLLEKYMDAYPSDKDNQTLKELYGILDLMEMTWQPVSPTVVKLQYAERRFCVRAEFDNDTV